MARQEPTIRSALLQCLERLLSVLHWTLFRAGQLLNALFVLMVIGWLWFAVGLTEPSRDYPANLDALVEEDLMRTIPKDPWGDAYIYRRDGAGGYVLLSRGLDSAEGSVDDIRLVMQVRGDSIEVCRAQFHDAMQNTQDCRGGGKGRDNLSIWPD